MKINKNINEYSDNIPVFISIAVDTWDPGGEGEGKRREETKMTMTTQIK